MPRFYAILALAAIALAPAARAQITITEADIRAGLSTPGTSTSSVADTTAANRALLTAIAAATGGGRTWDFRPLTIDTTFSSSFRVVSPPVPGSDDPHLAQANFILETRSDTTTAYSFTRLNATEQTLFGVAGFFNGTLTKIKWIPGLTQPLPLTSSSAWVEQSDLVFDPNPSPFPAQTSTREENQVVGWGTLITPAGSAGALMVRTLSISTQTITLPPPIPPIVTVDSSRSVQFLTRTNLGAFVSLDLDTNAATDGSFSATTPGTAAEPEGGGTSALRLSVGPNPSRGVPVAVRFALPEAGPATVRVYDGLGRLVATLADGALPAGPHALSWDAAGLPAGLYVVRVEAAGAVATTRVAVAR